ncbi:MAG TPA: cytochrome P450 [Trebonia sp.]|jgi:cytochrome P450|nr:cytochrome P450 [Trebonia sp.]
MTQSSIQSPAPAFDGDLFTDDVLADPYDTYATLRELGPVVWLAAHDTYVVTRYREARTVLGSPDVFCSGQGVALNDACNQQTAGRSLISTDGELHGHLRKILAHNITPRAIRHLEEQIQTQADALIGRLVARRSFDAVEDLATSLPLSIVPDLVGWPADGRDHLLQWAGATFNFLGPMNARARDAVPDVVAMQAFAAEMAAGGRLMQGSVGAGIVEAAANGELEPDRVAALIVGYLAPSLDTTISAMGSAIWLAATHPPQWDLLRRRPELIPNAFNEVVRFESPIRIFSRVTTGETSLGGVSLDPGTRVAVLYGSANRDPLQFPDPDTFAVDRVNAGEQLGFGHGVHSCAGQGLARMEAHALLSAMTKAVARIELAGPPVRAANNLINGWERLPVTVAPGS